MSPDTLVSWLDLLGTFVFGLSGAMLAVRRDLDVFGIAVLSVAAALSGGLIRDMALGATPPAALATSSYLLAALAAAGEAAAERIGALYPAGRAGRIACSGWSL